MKFLRWLDETIRVPMPRHMIPALAMFCVVGFSMGMRNVVDLFTSRDRPERHIEHEFKLQEVQHYPCEKVTIITGHDGSKYVVEGQLLNSPPIGSYCVLQNLFSRGHWEMYEVELSGFSERTRRKFEREGGPATNIDTGRQLPESN